MTIVTARAARARLFRLLDEVSEDHEPVMIAGPRHNAVIVSEEDWRAIEETLYLLAVPGMRESILDASREPSERMTPADALDW